MKMIIVATIAIIAICIMYNSAKAGGQRDCWIISQPEISKLNSESSELISPGFSRVCFDENVGSVKSYGDYSRSGESTLIKIHTYWGCEQVTVIQLDRLRRKLLYTLIESPQNETSKCPFQQISSFIAEAFSIQSD